MRATWLGEDGAPNEIIHEGIRFPAGRAVDVPESFGVGRLLGNPFFKLEGVPKPVDAVPVAVVDDKTKGGK